MPGDPLYRGREQHSATVVRGRDPQAAGKVALAGSAGSNQDAIVIGNGQDDNVLRDPEGEDRVNGYTRSDDAGGGVWWWRPRPRLG